MPSHAHMVRNVILTTNANPYVKLLECSSHYKEPLSNPVITCLLAQSLPGEAQAHCLLSGKQYQRIPCK